MLIGEGKESVCGGWVCPEADGQDPSHVYTGSVGPLLIIRVYSVAMSVCGSRGWRNCGMWGGYKCPGCRGIATEEGRKEKVWWQRCVDDCETSPSSRQGTNVIRAGDFGDCMYFLSEVWLVMFA